MRAKEKKRRMTGMQVSTARKRLLEIYAEAHPEVDFATMYPHVWPWMETWFRLRSRNETLENVAQAFSEKVSSLRKQNHHLQEIIRDQRADLTKKLATITELQAQLTTGE